MRMTVLHLPYPVFGWPVYIVGTAIMIYDEGGVRWTAQLPPLSLALRYCSRYIRSLVAGYPGQPRIVWLIHWAQSWCHGLEDDHSWFSTLSIQVLAPRDRFIHCCDGDAPSNERDSSRTSRAPSFLSLPTLAFFRSPTTTIVISHNLLDTRPAERLFIRRRGAPQAQGAYRRVPYLST